MPLRTSIANASAAARARLSNTTSAGNAIPIRTPNQFIETQPALVNKLSRDHSSTGQEESLSPPEQKVIKHIQQRLYYTKHNIIISLDRL